MNYICILYKSLNKWALALAIVFGVIGIYCGDNENSAIKLLCNIAYGYIAGYIFYIPSVVFPSVQVEYRKAKKILKLKLEVLQKVQDIENSMFGDKVIPTDSGIYGFEFVHKISAAPICRDLGVMNQDKPIKPEVLLAFSNLNDLVDNLISIIYSLEYDEKKQNALGILRKFSREYDLVIKPAVLHGELDKNIIGFSKTFCELKFI